MISSSDLKKELIEIQSLAEAKFQENLYQRLLITTISLLIIISILLLAISFFLRFIFNGGTLLGDFLLNLGTDFIGSTIIFIAFSILLKSETNKGNFRNVILVVFAIGIIAFIAAILNNHGKWLTYEPNKDSYFIADSAFRPDPFNFPSNVPTECSGIIISNVYNSNSSYRIVNNLESAGYINRHIESYYGQDIVNSLLLNISTQFIGALIIFVGVEQLFQIFEKQQEIQNSMLKRIELLAKQIE